MRTKANELELAKLKKRLNLMLVVLIACAALLIGFIAAAVFFYQLQSANPLLKGNAELNFYLPQNVALKNNLLREKTA